MRKEELERPLGEMLMWGEARGEVAVKKRGWARAWLVGSVGELGGWQRTLD